MNDINIEVVKISESLKANKLSLNIAKSKCMVFHHPLKKIPTLLLVRVVRVAVVITPRKASYIR